ncbi:MAG: hypothetical protein SGJ19_04930 [Planctomycetia bacterium]|nr:hypothetical protein [Planctomycetia bacterium]
MKYSSALGLALTLFAAPSAVAQVGGDAGGGTSSDGGTVTGAGADASGGGSGGLSGGPAGSQGGGSVGDFQVQGSSGVYSILPDSTRAGSYVAVADDVNAIINEGTPNSLEEALERAIKRNPEIALAAANRRQAEMAENLTKNKVFGSVVETYKQWQFELQALKSAEARHQAATISAEELLTAKQAVMKSETSLQFLLGGYSASWPDTGTGARSHIDFSANFTPQPGGGGLSGGGGPMGISSGGAGMMAPGGGAMAVEGAVGGTDPEAAAPASKFDEQLKQLSGPVAYDGMPVNDFAMIVTDLATVPVIVDHHSFDDAGGEMNFQITLSLKSDALTWKEVLTAVADTHDIGFIIRDYGILVTTKQKAAAQGIGNGFFGSGLGGAGSGGGFGGGGF